VDILFCLEDDELPFTAVIGTSKQTSSLEEGLGDLRKPTNNLESSEDFMGLDFTLGSTIKCNTNTQWVVKDCIDQLPLHVADTDLITPINGAHFYAY